MKILRILCIIMISFLFMGCPCGRFQDIEVYNNTKDSIFVYLAMNLKDSKDAIYPDTMLPIRDRFRIQDDTDLGKWPRGVFALIPPFSKGFVNHVYGEDNLEHYLPYDTLSVFFINKNAMEELGYDSVRASNVGIVRYDMSSSEIRNLGYVIPYPPQPYMSAKIYYGIDYK